MGWYYTNNASKKEIVEQVLRETAPGVVAHSVKGSILWTVEQSAQGVKYIGCYLLRGGTRRDPGYGYKAMDESCGPCYYDPPQKFLAMAPDPAKGYSTEWRAKVAEYQKAQAAQRELTRNVVAGCKITLKPEFGKGMTLDVIAVKGKKIRAVGCVDGRTYGVAPRMIAAIEYQLTSA
jgi:hypothetical protein